jgi:hypothetical protein
MNDDMRKVEAKWRSGNGWPKRLDWIEIDGVRGWQAQRFQFRFPMMAIGRRYSSTLTGVRR